MIVSVVITVVAFVLMAIGFGCGWYVRGAEVKKLKRSHEALLKHALDAGWVVTEKELMKNLAEHGVYMPYVPLQFTEYKD